MAKLKENFERLLDQFILILFGWPPVHFEAFRIQLAELIERRARLRLGEARFLRTILFVYKQFRVRVETDDTIAGCKWFTHCGSDQTAYELFETLLVSDPDYFD